MILTNSGVLKLMQRIKSYIASQLNTKASSVHTHSISEIDNLASQLGGGGYTKSEVDTLLTSKANTSHTHTSSDITDLTVDSTLSSSSENPVQNKVVKNALDGKLDVTDVFATWSYANGNLEIPNVFSNTVDSSLSNSSENPVQNKVINAALAGYIPKSGGAVITGTEFFKTSNGSSLMLCAGNAWNNGGGVVLWGKDHLSLPGVVTLKASDGTKYTSFDIYPSGGVTLNNNGTTKNLAMYEDVVPRRGGAVISGGLYRTTDDDTFVICGGKAYTTGATIYMRGALEASEPGWMYLSPRSGISTYKYMILKPDGTFTWNGTAIQYVSDKRLKQQITEIDDKLLDAWEDATLCQFKYNDAVDQKGDNARLHTGYVVQQIDEACKSHGVDISEYGLYCHEEYPEETEEVEVTQEDGTTTKETKVIREASEHYSLRYTETLVVECAYLRKKNKELQEQLDNVIARLDKLEKGDNVK